MPCNIFMALRTAAAVATAVVVAQTDNTAHARGITHS